MLARAGARLRDRGGDADGAVPRDDDAIDARAFRGAEEHAEVLRVLEGVHDEHQRRFLDRIEVQHELVEVHAFPSFDDGDDALVLLDRGEPREVELVDVVHEDAPLLRLGDEVVHRSGPGAALLRDVELADRAAGPDRLEHGVRSRDRLAGLLHRGSRRAARHAPDLVLVRGHRSPARGAQRHPASRPPAHRRAEALAARTAEAAATRTEARPARSRISATRTRRGCRPLPEAADGGRRAPAAVLLSHLALLVRRYLVRLLRALLVEVTRRGCTRGAERRGLRAEGHRAAPAASAAASRTAVAPASVGRSALAALSRTWCFFVHGRPSFPCGGMRSQRWPAFVSFTWIPRASSWARSSSDRA